MPPETVLGPNLDSRAPVPIEGFSDISPRLSRNGRTRRSNPDPSGPRKPINARNWAAAILVLGSIGWLLVEGMGHSLVYFRTVNQALSQRAQLASTVFRLEGDVVPNSVHRQGGGVSFLVAAGGRSVSVTNTGNPPQLFAPGMPVVVEGHFVAGSDRFVSNQILIKHTANYIAQHPGRVKGDPKS